MKRRFVFCLGAMLFAGTLAAQTPVSDKDESGAGFRRSRRTAEGQEQEKCGACDFRGPCLSGCRTAERGGNLSGDGKKGRQQGSGSFCTRG